MHLCKHHWSSNRSQAGRSLAANDQQSSTGSAQTLGWAADPLYSVCLRRTGGAFQGPLSSLIGIVLTPQSDPRQWPVHIVGQPCSTVPSHLSLLSLLSVGMSDARHEQEYLVLVGHRTQTAPQIGRSSGYAIERLPLYDAGCGPAVCGWHSYFEPTCGHLPRPRPGNGVRFPGGGPGFLPLRGRSRRTRSRFLNPRRVSGRV